MQVKQVAQVAHGTNYLNNQQTKHLYKHTKTNKNEPLCLKVLIRAKCDAFCSLET